MSTTILIDKHSDFTVIVEKKSYSSPLDIHFDSNRVISLDSRMMSKLRDTKAVKLFEKIISTRNFIYLE